MVNEIKRFFVVASLITSMSVLVACGGAEKGSDDNVLTDTQDQSTTQVLNLDANQLQLVDFDGKARMAGQTVSPQQTLEAGTFNATGGFKYPDPERSHISEFIGNLTVSIEAADEQGIKTVMLRTGSSEQALVLCSSSCGSSFAAMVNGLQPQNVGWESGQNVLQLWVEDNSGNTQEVGSVSIIWRELTISGVEASINTDTDQLTVSWSALSEAVRYNVYVATEPGHTGENFADLAGGEARLGLTTTTVTFEQKPEQQDYYILVTGVNGTGESAFSEEIVLIGGLAVNPPTAVEDSFSIDEDSELTGNLTNNDSAGGNTTLSINVEPIIAPALGVLTINSDGSFIYTPNPNENGVDQFTYEITNSQELSSSAIVTIEITPVNDLPVAVDDEATITSSTYSEQAPGLLANVTDVDGDTLTISLDAAHSPRFGSLQVNEDGSFVYTKGENFVTYDSFSYRVFDGTGFSNSVEMFIKSPEFSGFPPISFNDEYQVNEDTLLVVTSENGLLNNDFDDDHPDTKLSELTVSLEQAGAHGTLALSDDGSFSYGPNENFNGLDSFQYRVTDPDGNSTTAVVSITVHPVNDLPIAVDDEAIITSSTYLEEAPGLLANVTDVDGDTLSISLDLERLPRFGSVQVNEDGSFVYTKGDNFVTYDSFSYRASDGTEFTAPVEMALRSPEFNGFPPISVNDEYEVNEGASLVVDAENGVLNNDFDDDHANSELIISVERTAEHGTFSFSDGGDGSFSYEPNENFNGLDSFLYRLTDPDGNSTTGFVAITVIPQNDPPVAVGEQYVVARDLTINIAGGLGLLRNDLDIDGDTLEVSSNTQPGSGSVIVEPDGAFVYTPGEGFVGVDSFTYRVTDGLLNSDEATVQLVVTEMHAETDDQTALELDIGEVLSDLPDGAEISTLEADKGQVETINGTITYTPPIGLDIIDVISVEITTGSEISSFNLLIKVDSDNLPPSFTSVNTTTFDENATTGTPVYMASATDEQDITYYLDENETRFDIDTSSGEVTVLDITSFNFEQTPTFEFTVFAQDIYFATSSLVITVTLNDVAEAPEFTSPSQFTIVENTVNGSIIYNAQATDPEGNEVSYSLTDINNIFDINGETGALFVFNNTGLDHESIPSYQVTISAYDGESQSNFNVEVQIDDINEAPIITSETSFSIDENEPNGTTTGYMGQADDPENNNLNWSIVEDEFGIFAIDSNSGVLTVADNTNLDYEAVSSYILSLMVSETNGSPSNLTDTQFVTVNIINLDEQTDSDGDGLSDEEESELGTDHLDSDSDDDGLSDGDEVNRGTDPLDVDSDDDELSDGAEVEAGTDPLNPDVTPANVTFVSPFNGASDICTNQTISVTFNEPVQAESITASSLILRLEGETEVGGSLGLAGNNTELFFAANEALQASSNFTVSVSGVLDSAGNPMVETFSSNFTTGTCVESDRPSVVTTNPKSGSNNIPQSTQVTVTIDEPIDPSTVNASSVYVIDQTTGLQVPGSLQVSDNKMVITFTPDMPLFVGRQHYAYVTSAVKDLFGNGMNHASFYFYVSFEGDVAPPNIVSTSMLDSQTNVPINARSAVQFDEPINASLLEQVQLLDGEDAVVPATMSLSDDRQRVMLTPEQDLDTSSSYTFIVEGIQDLAGNGLAASTQISFTTGEESDTETGTDIAWSIPVNNTQNVPLNPILEVTLSEPIDPTTVNDATFYLWDNETGFKVNGSRNVSDDRTKLTFTPDELLAEGHRYYLYVGYWPYLHDLAGNIVAQNRYRYFTTGEVEDTSEPTISATNILDGTTSMPINGQVVLVFDQELSDACMLDGSVQLVTGETDVPVTVTLGSDRRTIAISGESAFDIDTSYQLTISGVCDYAGNRLTAQTITFTTTSNESNDTSGPSLVSITPTHQATDVSILTTIVLEYDEDVDLRAKPPVNGAGLTIPGDYEVEGNTITFTPHDSLLGSTRYTIELYHNVPDLAGNTTWGSTRYFDTQELVDSTPPTVVAVSPADGSVDIDPNQSVVISFDEPINNSTLNSNNIALYINGSILNSSIFRSSDGKDVTLSAFLPSSSLISVVINDAVTDLAGNPLAPFVSTFTTGEPSNDLSRPSIIKRAPENGTSGWLGIRDVYFYTNEAMSSEGLQEALHISENGVLIDVDISVIGDGRTIKVSKATDFVEGALIQYFWNENLTDTSGNPVYEYNGYFRMDTDIDEAGVRPYVTAYYPNSGTQETPLNPVLMTSFTEDIDASTLTATTVTLSDVTAGWVELPVTISLGSKENVIEVRPDAALVPDNQYYLWFSAEIKDTDGDNLSSNHATYFYTYESSLTDDRPPVIEQMSPPSGETGVGTLAYFSVKYDERMNTISFDHDNATNVQFSESDRIVKYNLSAPLPPLAEHTESSPLFVDLSGNEAASMATTFTTANGPDFINPTVTDTAYVNNQQNVVLNPVFEWDFSEPIDPNSVTSGGVYIWDNVTNQVIPSTFELSPDGKRLTVIPSEELLVLRRYYQYAYYMHDLSGNGLGNHYRYVNTGTSPDHTPPSVLNTGIHDGDIDLPTNLKLNVRFDEPLNPLNIDGISLQDEMGETIPANVTLNRGRTLVTVTPRQLLQPFSNYQLMVDSLTDLAGNSQAAALVLNFSTGATVDMTAGSAIRWSIPVNNTQNVPLNPLLQVSFSERVDKATIDSDSVYLWDEVTGVRVPSTWELSEDGLTLTLTPSQLLRENARHYFYVGQSPFLTDLAANPVALHNYRYFTTGTAEDNTSPAVSRTNILDGNMSMPINGRLVLTLDEPLADACLLEQGLTITSSAGAHEFSASLGSDRQTITVTSASTFEPLTSYTLSIDGICDYAGNPISGYTLNFTTLSDETPDTSGPTLVSISPSHQATDVVTSLSSIVMVYNEPVDLYSAPPIKGGSITLPGEYNVSGDTITFTPSVELLGGTRYTVELYRNVPDLAGNTTYGGTQYFETVAEMETVVPTVVAVSPANGATDTDPDQEVVISFSEPMATSTLNTSNIALYHNGSTISLSISRSADGKRVTLNATLPQNALISIVLNDAITDLSGNALVPQVTSFTTGGYDNDTGRPSITQQIPSNGSSGWTDLDTIILYASEALDPASLVDALTIEEDGVLTTADINVSGDNRTITISKDGGFSLGKRTSFYLSGITDTSGNLMYDYSGSIAMASNVDRAGERPFVTAYYPNSGSPSTPLNPVLMTSFNEPMDLSSLTDTRVTLSDVTGAWVEMGISWALSENGKVIEVVPDDELVPNNQYYLWFSNEILDTDGDQLNSNYATYFNTYEDSVVDDMRPSVVAMSPPQDEQSVGTNAQFSIRFDEPMNNLSLDVDQDRKVNVMFSENYNVVTYDHMFPLAPSSEITEVMDGMRDLAGNLVVAASTTFNTTDGPDFVNPSLIDVGFFNNQQDVPTNPVIEWVFSEPIDLISVSDSGVYIWNDNTNQTVGSSWELSADGKRLTVMPDEALETGSRHYAYAYSMRDLSGNNLGNHYRYFTISDVSDVEAPVIESTTLFEGQTDVPTNVKLKVRFNEILNPIPPASVKLMDSSNQEVPINVSLTRERKLLNIVPKQLLSANASYTLTVAGMKDISGNGQETPLVQTFTTGLTVDLSTSGVRTWSIPVNNTQNVPLNPLLEVTFFERVDKSTVDEGSFYLWNTATAERVPGGWTLSSDGLTLTFAPDELLQEDTRHYLYVGHSPFLMDMAGNRIAQNNSRYFTTGFAEDTTPLAVSGTSIFDGNTDMPINGRVVMVMDNPISDACLFSDNIELKTSDVDVPIDVSLASNRQTITIIGQSNFEPNTQYDLSIVSLCDYAGNSLSGSVLSFTTLDSASEDLSGPTIVSITPSNGATDVAVTSSIVIQYNEPVDALSAPPVKVGSTVIAGSYNVVGDTVTFTPVNNLLNSTTYTIELYYNVPDLTGRTVWGSTTTFTTIE